MKLYIAAANQEDTIYVSKKCIEGGHVINSTWLDEDFFKTWDYTDMDRRKIADKDIKEVLECDALVLLASSYRVTGGKFVEVGAALGNKIPVFILGHRENMIMYHSLTLQFDSVEDMLKYIK